MGDDAQAAAIEAYFHEVTKELFELMLSAQEAAARGDTAGAMALGEQAWQLVNTVGHCWQAYVLNLAQILLIVLEDKPIPDLE